MINYDVPLNSRGNNAALRSNQGVSEETMKANGFTLYEDRWTLKEYLGNSVSLYIDIRWNAMVIDVIDDNYGQPYDYQWMLDNAPEAGFSLSIHSKVQATMKRLSDAGIIEGYVANDYI